MVFAAVLVVDDRAREVCVVNLLLGAWAMVAGKEWGLLGVERCRPISSIQIQPAHFTSYGAYFPWMGLGESPDESGLVCAVQWQAAELCCGQVSLVCLAGAAGFGRGVP